MKNKLYSLLLMGSTLIISVLDGDATSMVFVAIIAIPMFFAKENWILGGRYEN